MRRFAAALSAAAFLFVPVEPVEQCQIDRDSGELVCEPIRRTPPPPPQV